MKCDFDWGNLVHWARDDLGLPLDAEFSISEERARELLAQIAAEDKDRPLMELVAAYGNEMRRILAAHVKDAGGDGECGARVLDDSRSKCREVCQG